LLCAADSRFIPERGNPLGRTTKKPAVRQVFGLLRCRILRYSKKTGRRMVFC